jgi:glutamyl-tRNA synthetase
MAITHVVRGDDHLSNTPKQLMLYAALGAEPPRFGHLSMIVGTDGKPLSKRFADVSVGSYRAKGYLPDAMVNFLALLGWSLDDKTTVMDRATLIAGFSLDRVTSKPAVWDIDKLDWMNGVYIRSKSDEELAELLAPFVQREGYGLEPARLTRAVPLVKERMKVLEDAVPLLGFLGAVDPELEEDAQAALQTDDARRMLAASLEALESLPVFETAEIESALREVAEELGLKTRVAFQPVRIAITGSKVSPPLFDSLALLGKEVSLRRIARALKEWAA